MLKFWRIGVLLCVGACGQALSGPEPPHLPAGRVDYAVTIFDNLGGARVRACIESQTIRELVPIERGAARRLLAARAGGVPLETSHGRIPIQGIAPCVQYETRFEPNRFHVGESTAVIISQSQWLWRPAPFSKELDVTVHFILPRGVQASLPWPRLEADYLPDESAFFLDTYAVFGEFQRFDFSVGGTRIEVVELGARPAEQDIRRWLSRAVQTAGSLGDAFPRERLHFVVVPLDGPAPRVAFGMVRRGGGASILLLPSKDAAAPQLEADWVAIHELSHLWMPRVRPEDRWLTEGIATYLQEVLRARCGLQSSERAWARLHEGFERGRRSRSGRALAVESRHMNRTGAYQRVYWSGAAFALEVDVRLRQSSRGRVSLFSVLRDAQPLWKSSSHATTADALLSALDRAGGGGVVQALGAQYAQSSDFPSTPYVNSSAYVSIRQQITSRASRACGLSDESSR